MRSGAASARRASARRSSGGSTRAPGTRSSRPIRPPTTELAIWCPLAWMKLGEADLAAGKHAFEFRLSAWSKPENGKQVAQGIMFACDATCLIAGPVPAQRQAPGPTRTGRTRKTSRPPGRSSSSRRAHHLRPRWAAAGGERMPERVELPLGGLWQVGRFDEQEVVRPDGPTHAAPGRQAIVLDGHDRAQQQVPGPAGTVAVPPADLPHAGGGARRVGRPVLHLPLPGGEPLRRACSSTAATAASPRRPYASGSATPPPPSGPGEVNEVCVVIKDSYYAVSPKLAGPGLPRNSFSDAAGHVEPELDAWRISTYPIGSGVFEHPHVLGHPADAQPGCGRAGLHERRVRHPLGQEEDAGAGNHGDQPDIAAADRCNWSMRSCP